MMLLKGRSNLLNADRPPRVAVNNTRIPFVNSHRVLGVVLDSTLTFRAHVEYIGEDRLDVAPNRQTAVDHKCQHPYGNLRGSGRSSILLRSARLVAGGSQKDARKTAIEDTRRYIERLGHDICTTVATWTQEHHLQLSPSKTEMVTLRGNLTADHR